jgi:hypothetical protein
VAIGDWLRPCLLEGSAENAQDIEITALWE